MITRIPSLKRFGIYRDFQWPEDGLQEFRKFNLIYGWNYSGKTTLAPVLQTKGRGVSQGREQGVVSKPPGGLDSRANTSQGLDLIVKRF